MADLPQMTWKHDHPSDTLYLEFNRALEPGKPVVVGTLNGMLAVFRHMRDAPHPAPPVVPEKPAKAEEPAVDPRLDNYDWAEAFAYAGEGAEESQSGYGSPDLRRAHPTREFPVLTPFGRQDVRVVEALEEGENDGSDWLCLGQLKDGRWFLLSAGCDYTGWDCRAGGTATVAIDREELLSFGITDEQRKRLGV